MSPLLPFAHKMAGHAAGLVAGGGAVATVKFSDQITLGSIIATCAVLIVAGLVTIRSRIAKVWREEAEGEKAKAERLQADLEAERAARLEFEKQQQELRHDLKDELAGVKAANAVLEAKTDLSSALETIRQMNETTVKTVTEAIAKALEERDGKIHKVLVEIRDLLPTTGGP